MALTENRSARTSPQSIPPSASGQLRRAHADHAALQSTSTPAIKHGGAITTVSQGAGGSDMTIFVANAAAIASTPGQYFILIDGEEMEVTNVNLTLNSISVTRGVNGVSASTIAIGDAVYLFFDQRGGTRAIPPDIGAFQYGDAIITPGTLPTAIAGVTFSQQLTASGGTAPYTFSETGSLDGLTLTTGGLLSGIPAAAGTFSFVVTASAGNTGTQSFSLIVNRPNMPLIPGQINNGVIYFRRPGRPVDFHRSGKRPGSI